MTSVAVIDVETTGFNFRAHDRIVEVGAVVLSVEGGPLREFATLVNPDRDIGRTDVHGLNARDILPAPRFEDVAGALVRFLNGSVALAGHNVGFDVSFLSAEFDRLGYAFPACPRLCTMQLAGGGRLWQVCEDYEIEPHGSAHDALSDARAASQLLLKLLADAPLKVEELLRSTPIIWPRIPSRPVTLLTRKDSRRVQAAPPGYLQRLLDRMPGLAPADEDDSATLAYLSLIDQVLEDRRITDEEGEALYDFAEGFGIPSERIRELHWEYLVRLGEAALADGNLTDAERRDLTHVALLLGVTPDRCPDILAEARQKLSEAHTQTNEDGATLRPTELQGSRVCFTGQSQCLIDGRPLTRSVAYELASSYGLTVAESVTKNLSILVVADPYTLSGKAKKARRYGIRIMQESVFWRALGEEVG